MSIPKVGFLCLRREKAANLQDTSVFFLETGKDAGKKLDFSKKKAKKVLDNWVGVC